MRTVSPLRQEIEISGVMKQPKESSMKRIFVGLFLILLWDSSLDAQTPFYQGKTITLVGICCWVVVAYFSLYWKRT